MHDLLRQLGSQWYARRAGHLQAPRLGRVWGLAVHERDKRLRDRVSDFEPLGLVHQTLDYCLGRFDPSAPPRGGSPGRRTLEDRFVYFFRFKFIRILERYAHRLRGDNGRPGDARYQGPHGRRYRSAEDRTSGTALWHLVHRAVDRLDERDQAILTLRYWEDAGFAAIAARVGLSGRFKARREHDRILRKLRALLEWEMANTAWAA